MSANSSRPPAMPSGQERADEESGRDGLLVEVLRWLAGIVVAGAGIFWLLDGLRVGRVWPFSRTLDGSSMYDLSRSTVALTGLLGATVAVAIGIRRQRSTEKSVRISSEAQRITAEAYQLEVARHGQEQTRDLRTRFTDAAKQLGDSAAAVRLAGVYAMAALADDWLQRGEPHEAQSCIDVLCAYVRTPRLTSPDEDSRADIEIRQTIARSITARLQANADPKRDWRGRNFDFTGAIFNGTYDFAGIVCATGTISFARARFSGGLVDFQDASFCGGRVTFEGATFDGAVVYFGRMKVDGSDVSFASAVFSPDGPRQPFKVEIAFSSSQFTTGRVSFEYAKFSGRDVEFMGLQFGSCEVTFGRAQFAGRIISIGMSWVNDRGLSFEGVELFDGGGLSFPHTKFASGETTFSGAKLAAGSSLDFRGAQFPDKGRITLALLEEEGTITGPWPDGQRPGQWPPSDAF